jgi:hypothetical protein
MNRAVKYAAELNHVREVSLLGSADLTFWIDRLAKEGLAPAEEGGMAKVLVIAADARFMGLRFREVSFSVLVARPEGGDAAFLTGAYNSNRFFAFCERAFFSTPYQYAAVRVCASLPVSVEVARGDAVVFRAEMSADVAGPAREPSQDGEGGWAGPVFLPGGGGETGRQGRAFFAKVSGRTRTYPFLDSADSLSVLPPRDDAVLGALVDSGFSVETWSVRENAAHSKSKTYKRPDLLAALAAAPRSAT